MIQAKNYIPKPIGKWLHKGQVQASFRLPSPPAARVVKLVDIPDLGSGAARHGGSSPSTRTRAVPTGAALSFQLLVQSKRFCQM